MKKPGQFEGRAVVQFLADGRRVQLIEPFAFHSSTEVRWPVPSGAIVDGASIPKVLWSVLGGPFEGQYRDASIIHDWYRDLRSRRWREVHAMFYEAMLASGVPPNKARIMYLGVYMGGPRWSETVVENVRLFMDRSTSDDFTRSVLPTGALPPPSYRAPKTEVFAGTLPSLQAEAPLGFFGEEPGLPSLDKNDLAFIERLNPESIFDAQAQIDLYVKESNERSKEMKRQLDEAMAVVRHLR